MPEEEKNYLAVIQKRIIKGNSSEIVRDRVQVRGLKTGFREAILNVYSELAESLIDNQIYFGKQRRRNSMSSRTESKRQTDFFDTCSRCRTGWSCCHETTPPVTGKRRKIIEAYLRANRISLEKPFVEAEYVFPRLTADGYCVFHDKKTRKCLIHPVKPETCVAGPITFDIKAEASRIEWFIKMDKICSLAGRVYLDKVLLQRHVDSAKKEIFKLVSELDSEALIAILKKEEPATFKIGEDNLGRCALKRLERHRQTRAR